MHPWLAKSHWYSIEQFPFHPRLQLGAIVAHRGVEDSKVDRCRALEPLFSFLDFWSSSYSWQAHKKSYAYDLGLSVEPPYPSVSEYQALLRAVTTHDSCLGVYLNCMIHIPATTSRIPLQQFALTPPPTNLPTYLPTYPGKHIDLTRASPPTPSSAHQTYHTTLSAPPSPPPPCSSSPSSKP